MYLMYAIVFIIEISNGCKRANPHCIVRLIIPPLYLSRQALYFQFLQWLIFCTQTDNIFMIFNMFGRVVFMDSSFS